MTQPATQRKRPDWDPHGIAEPYLISLREDAREGRFEPKHVDDLMESLVLDLREVYGTRNIDRALEHLERIRANIEHQAQEARSLHTDLAQVRTTGSDLSQPLAGPATLKAVDAARKWLKIAAAQLAKTLPIGKAAIACGQSALQTTRAPRRAAEVEAPRISSRSPLNGRALRKSVVPTWVLLVGCSWIALIWGALITLPIGIGVGIFASMAGGIFVVPLWGTVFGFLGMGSARTATLRQMQFKPLSPYDRLREQAARYANQLDIPVPELGSIPAFNAFAMGSGPRDATVAIGEPLRSKLTVEEVDAVLAHELGHVVSGDMRRMMLMRTFQNATVWFMLFNGAKQFVRWVICWVAELAILGFSRKREYWADAIGAALAGKDAMIGALRKLDEAPPLSWAENTHARFMVRGRVSGLLNTHPSIDQRIRALEAEIYLKRLPRRPG
jgi:heat shock protein HtpX